MAYNAYRESRRAELRSRLRLARAAVRVPEPRPWEMVEVRTQAQAHRLISHLYPPSISRLEMEGWEAMAEDADLRAREADWEDHKAARGWLDTLDNL